MTGAAATFPDLAGASVFVTGGASGIGAALVAGFLAQGARVAFADIVDGTALAGDLARRHGRAPLALRCDVTDAAALRDALAAAAVAHGAVTRLVGNAADDTRRATLETSEAELDASLAVNFKHYFLAAQAVLPGMRAAGGGAIVNLSSISYMMGAAGYAPYIAANAAIVGLTRSLAREFGPDGVRVNALAPGWVLTERQRRLWVTPEALAAHLARQCLPQEIRPEDVVDPCLFLASDAARMVTGQTLVVDGGVVHSG